VSPSKVNLTQIAPILAESQLAPASQASARYELGIRSRKDRLCRNIKERENALKQIGTAREIYMTETGFCRPERDRLKGIIYSYIAIANISSTQLAYSIRQQIIFSL